MKETFDWGGSGESSGSEEDNIPRVAKENRAPDIASVMDLGDFQKDLQAEMVERESELLIREDAQKWLDELGRDALESGLRTFCLRGIEASEVVVAKVVLGGQTEEHLVLQGKKGNETANHILASRKIQ